MKTSLKNFIKTLNKSFNNLSKEQQALIDIDIEKINEKCRKIVQIYDENERKYQINHDDKCPNCFAKKDSIVNKIRHVEGGGDVSGSFSLGFGSVHGSMSIDTNDVNHCNKCGNEWKKYKYNTIWSHDTLCGSLNYLTDVLKDPTDKIYAFKVERIKIFDDCYAESIYQLCYKYDYRLYSWTKDWLTLKNLRNQYKSIFDVE